MAEPCLIRPASPADVPGLVAIERACFSDPWTASGIRETIQYETTRAFVAESGGRTVGYVMARISGEEGEILNLAVLPGSRRKGIARCLLSEALGSIAAAGVTEAYLEVRQSNGDAIKLYQAHGFRPVGVRPDYYRDPREDALVLRAPLAALR
ncbi:MAG TPA: ribosomal protein S18-alanine N-acetyltransferase [Gemmatimonadales bacterium]|nr:ribosomal protein S18-alanine N-acetyltransferase [Gemmatimonadales bacterium]